MNRIRAFLTAIAIAAAIVPLYAQTSLTIQPATVSQIVNGTITAGTSQLPSCQSADVRINITTTGTATGTLQLFIQDSTDAGTTFHDLIASNPFTFGAAVTTQRFNLNVNIPGPGLYRVITGSTPSAGADISETVPANTRWELLAFRGLLTTSATVANRLTELTLDDGTTEYFRSGTSGQQAASIIGQHSFSQGFGLLNFDGNANWSQPLPPAVMLLPGHRIRTVTNNIQAADAWTAVRYQVREWHDIGGAALEQENFPAGLARSGSWGDRWRVREKVSGIGGSPVGPSYTITAACKG